MANAISNSVQFIGADAVLKAYLMRGVPSWSIWHNRQFLFKQECDDCIEGEKMLRDHLNMLSGSVATYTLCVYEDLGKMKIKSKTEHDGSFNFQLSPRENGGYENGAILREIRQSQIEQENRLALLENDADESEVSGVGRVVGMVKEIMSIPGIGEMISGIVQNLTTPKNMQIASIGNISGPQEMTAVNVANDTGNHDEQEAQQLGQVFFELKERMPELLETMQKLLLLSKTDPDKFNTYRNLLKSAL